VVVLHHCLLVVPGLSAAYLPGGTVPPGLRWATFSPLHLFWAGGEAVMVFFVLSGLVLTLAVERSARFRWRSYYPSRAVRLYLPVIASVLLALALALLVPRGSGSGRSTWTALHDSPPTLLGILGDMTLLPGTDYLNSPLWSLRWEVLFSLLLPLYVTIARRSGRWWPLLGLVTIGASELGVLLDVAPITYMPVFMLGCLVGTRYDSISRRAASLREEHPRSTAVLLVASALGLTSAWWSQPLLGAGSTAASWPVVLVAAALVVVLSVVSPTLARTLQSRAWAWLGTISFSLYLTHEPIVVTIALLLPPDAVGWTTLLALPLSLLAAQAFFALVERPSHQLAAKVAAWVPQAAPASGPTRPSLRARRSSRPSTSASVMSPSTTKKPPR